MNYDPKNTFNTISSKIIQSVNVLTNFTCPNSACENNELDAFGNCTVCGYTNDTIQNSLDDLEISILKLNAYFKNGITRTYHFLNKLYAIRDKNIDFVNELLLNLDYEKTREKELHDLREKYNNESIDKEETRRLESLLITEDNLEELDFDILIKMVFNKMISKNTFKKLVLLATEKFALDEKIPLNKVEYGKTALEHDAETHGFDIVFQEKSIDKMYDLNEQDTVFFLIFHELSHVIQNADLKNNKITPNTCKYVYDTIIRENEEDFYNENYNLINQEIDANIRGYIYTKRLKDKYNINYPENILKQQIKSQLALSNITDRNVSNYIINYHDLVLKSIIKNPEYLKQFPHLQIEFKIENGVIMRKDKKEIMEEIEKYNEMKNHVFLLKDTYGIENFKDVFTNESTKSILQNEGITYDKFYDASNINRVRLSVLDYYDSLSEKKEINKKNNRGYGNFAILILSIVAVILLFIFIGIIIHFR